jgi:uncharacterized protein (DUF924 family)
VIHGVKAQDVHRFWFEDATADPQAAQARNGVWFGASADFDAAVRQRFEPAIDTAARGELASWEKAPQSCVSLVIVLDQFPRNVHRASPGAFAYDALALAVTKRAIAAGHRDALSEPERAFLLMPYQHVEDAAAQREGVALFEQMRADAPPAWHAFCDGILRYAHLHLEIIERFGRFPHRNAVLGRSSTPEEREYLDSKPEAFGQG